MAGKGSKNQSINLNKYENEIEKLRDENKWLKLRDLISGIPNKDIKSEILLRFYLAESDLETYIYSNPSVLSLNQQSNETSTLSASSSSLLNTVKSEGSMSSATSPADDAQKLLYDMETTFKDFITKTDISTLEIQANILLAKLFFCQMRFEEAYKALSGLKVSRTLNEQIMRLKQSQERLDLGKLYSLRELQVYAEGHAIKGLCAEKRQLNQLNINANYRGSDEYKRDEQEIIDLFEVASRFSVEHSLLAHSRLVQSSPTGTPSALTPNQPNSAAGAASANFNTIDSLATTTLTAMNNSDDNIDLINPLYEIALQKAPVLYIKKGDLQLGVRKFRELLLRKNIQSVTSIRQILLRKFAETLMFNIPPSQYLSLPRSNDDRQRSLYKPTNQDEETLLCLMLSQYLASKEVMLFRHAQFKNIREYTFNNAITSLDLLIVFLAYHRSHNILIDKFEMTMKYSFEQFYVWYQYGLTLICDQKYYKAYMVLKECSRMKPDNVTCHLLLARLALENLLLINEAIEWCQKVNQMTGNKNKQALILYGSALCFKAKLQKQHSSQISIYEQAMDSFKKCNAIDPADYLAYFHIAHCHAIFRQINEAIENIQKALKFKPDDKDSLHLLALLLTSTKNYEEAHTVISKACALYNDFELLFTKIKIEEILYGFNYSVTSLLNLILIYKQKLQAPNDNMSTRSSSAVSLTQPILVNTNKNAPVANQNVENWSSFDSASLLNLQNEYKLNESIGKTITMLVQTDQIALKYGNSYAQSQNVEQVLILVRLLAQIGEFYLRHDRLADAENCCQEMASIHPMSYLYIYLKGRILEYKGEFQQAKQCYQNALSINPYHIQSLQQIALVLCQLENFHLAEKMIREAISLNSSLPESWHILARILDFQNDNQSAIKCYQTCVQLESTNPIIPFTSLTRII